MVQDFINKFKAKFNETPDGLAAMGYDAAKVLIAAMQNAANLTPKSIRDEIAKTKDFQMVTGKISLDEQRNAVKSAVVVKVDGPNFKYVTTVNP